ncbi:MAG: response regulator [Bryobacterales bacterium]|jgi:CheY-like chemotaxis protein|nr:response regulator [Bryobacterales bacterium]
MSKTILIVDDSPTELKLMMATLHNKGYNVITATDGEEAFAKIAASRPDMVLLDVVMPKKNGYQVCRQIKTTPATKDIRVVLVTSKNQESDRFWGLKQGADGYLTKPYRAEDLAELVSKYA